MWEKCTKIWKFKQTAWYHKITSAARKSPNNDHREYRDFGREPWFLAIALILRHGRDYGHTVYKISTVELLWHQIGALFHSTLVART